MTKFSIGAETSGKTVILKLQGSVDANTAPEFSRVLRESIGMGHAGVICDLSEVPYVSSAFLGAIYSKQQDARDNRGEIILAAPNAEVLDVLEQVNIKSVVKITATVAEAIRQLPVE